MYGKVECFKLFSVQCHDSCNLSFVDLCFPNEQQANTHVFCVKSLKMYIENVKNPPPVVNIKNIVGIFQNWVRENHYSDLILDVALD